MYNSKGEEPMIVLLSDLYSKVEAISVSTSRPSFCFYQRQITLTGLFAITCDRRETQQVKQWEKARNNTMQIR